jgi:hypothetical protein
VDDIGLGEVHSCCISEKRNHVEIGELRSPLSRSLAAGPDKRHMGAAFYFQSFQRQRDDLKFSRIKVLKHGISRF